MGLHSFVRLGDFQGQDTDMINHPNRGRKTRAVNVTAATPKRAQSPRSKHDADYASLRQHIAIWYLSALDAGPVFQTDAENLFDTFLKHLPAERQIHTCNCCRKFFKDYGGLVRIDPKTGETSPLLSIPVPNFYSAAIGRTAARVARANVTAPFISAETIWGTPHTGIYTHLHAMQPTQRVHRDRLLTAGQAMAAKRHNFETVSTALSVFTPERLADAMRVLEADALSRSEKFIAPVQWMQELHENRKHLGGKQRDNVVWRAIATAPEGYCHPRASVIGSLLEDIEAGLPFRTIQKRFNEKLHPLQYQRPQAAPKAGTIVAAERIVEQLGIERSLHRRYARLDEIEALWRPSPPKALRPRGKTFGHLSARSELPAASRLTLPTQTMTWEKFSRVVLPEAERIEMLVPTSRANFMAFVTAAHADAPPILKWDRLDSRNPVSLYVYHGGSPANQWGLIANTWTNVTAISGFPFMWGDRPQPHHGDGVLFALERANDSRSDQGNALFPETMRDDLHAVRSVIEAHSKTAAIAGRGPDLASGLGFAKNGKPGYQLRVTSRGNITEYCLDRWD